jgi:hypothetical protein
MTTYVPATGVQLPSTFGPDGKTRMPCPYCTHIIPDVTLAQRTIYEVTGVATWIDCACFTGQGESPFNVHLSGCNCIARFRVKPVGGGRYEVDGVDYPTMEARRVEREEVTYAPMDDAPLPAALPAPPTEPAAVAPEEAADTPLPAGHSRPILSDAHLVDEAPKPKRSRRTK